MPYPQTQIETCQRLIKKYGQEAVFVSVGIFTPDNPDEPSGPGTTAEPIEHDVWVCPLPEDRQGYEWVKYIIGTEIPEGNGYLLMAGGLSFEPKSADSIILSDGRTITIDKFNVLGPSGVPILYTVKL